ncbi:NADH-quinone oxidoreductase subunit L [Rubrobacter tropicus]|uniref:NADH-quinone oxidoreductase subunit L n=1 Tax=Rubrobacter tropicus TaxID=2653851 RepID=A0A6G8QE07_9ACTN|nr:NADH-quinone oxidoreductase subunit L [Rubrobacter tropicus]QIN84477.1 NADH-quinone oxidoreductase subunit L [Rubrobacter tropicus]
MTIAALTILGPLAAATVILLLRRGASAFALLGTGVALFGALVTLVRVSDGGRYSATLPGLPDLPLRLVVNPLTAVLATFVAVVSFFVMVYAVGYMKEEGGKPRFFAGMSLFAAAMQALVVAGDWVLLLAAWEIIGFLSFLLIGFYYERPGVGGAAMRAFLYTRSADLGLYGAIFVLISQTGTSGIRATLDVGGTAAIIVGLFLLLAAAGKSAQAPLQGWLQSAMVGPTPVSALLHSATLVAAGAILLIRTSPLLPPPVLLVVGLLGGVTAIVSGLIAVGEGDLKRLLAASTSSQYGFMLLAVGAGSPVAATVHLIAHAAMKSSLFLGAGVFQHARGSTAFGDLEGAGRGRRWTFAGFVLAGLALAGVPPLSGFWSKDAVLAAVFGSAHAWLLAPLLLAGTLLTAVYVGRALALLWRGEGRDERVAGAGWMGAGLATLVVLAATLGLALEPLAALLGEEVPKDLLVAGLGIVLALVGLPLGWSVPAGRLLGPLRGAAGRGFRFGGGFDGLVARPAMEIARALDAFDRGIHALVLGVGRGSLALADATRISDERGIDGLISALVRGTRDLGGRARVLQSGLVHKELLLAVAGGAVLLALLALGAVTL